MLGQQLPLPVNDLQSHHYPKSGYIETDSVGEQVGVSPACLEAMPFGLKARETVFKSVLDQWFPTFFP